MRALQNNNIFENVAINDLLPLKHLQCEAIPNVLVPMDTNDLILMVSFTFTMRLASAPFISFRLAKYETFIVTWVNIGLDIDTVTIAARGANFLPKVVAVQG